MKPVEPIFTAELFLGIHDELVALLCDLDPKDWGKPTACALWSVKDIAAHLLDGDIRRLSLQRDGLAPPPPEHGIAGWDDLVGFLNRLNAEWVQAMRRVSPGVLIELLSVTGPRLSALFRSLDPFAPAPFPVAWAGEESSLNWFDIAREYTEKWLHQQQIREAVGRRGLMERRWLFPVLDAFMRALPHAYREVDAPPGTRVVVGVEGEAGGEWTLSREGAAWRLSAAAAADPAARVRLSQDAAWRLFSKGLAEVEARRWVRIEGDERLGSGIFGMVSVMA